ncbi:hypothetical protein C8R47DRAFT_1103069 [Mycena vitilis]|nr:hypothetical protein C8R47DRAFT_1103069 [Mycena vitilis]
MPTSRLADPQIPLWRNRPRRARAILPIPCVSRQHSSLPSVQFQTTTCCTEACHRQLCPNPGLPATIFPDGSSAKLISLGEPLEPGDIGTAKWWPSAIPDKVRRKLIRRISYEGYALPVAMSICLALLAEIYHNRSGGCRHS